jgi:hypothetical protein
MYLKNAVTGAVIPLSEATDESEIARLFAQRYNNFPVWEEASEIDAVKAGLITASEGLYALVCSSPEIKTIGADALTSLGVVEVAGVVKSAEYYPAASKSGADTNTRTLNVLNSGINVATLALVNGVNLTAVTKKSLTVTVNGTDMNVDKGDELFFQSLHVLNGITDPGGTAVVTYEAS